MWHRHNVHRSSRRDGSYGSWLADMNQQIIAAASFSEVIELFDVLIWPLVVLLAICIAVSDRGRRLLRPIFRRLRKVSAGGFTVELSEEAASATKADIEGTVREFSAALRSEFDRLAYAEGIRDRMKSAVMGALQEANLAGKTYRATVHVRDALYGDALYQLVSYWPEATGAGRRFPIRFGILGRAWRLEQSQYEGNVPTKTADLVSSWGMTQEQAEMAARGRQSFVCIVLRHEGLLVGVLYMDAVEKNAFLDDIVARLENSQQVPELAAAVDRIRSRIATRGPGLNLLQSG